MVQKGDFAPVEHFRRGASITPHDSTNFPRCDAIWVGDGNTNLTVVLESGDVVTFLAVPDGTLLPVSAVRVNDTDTDAAGLIRLNW